MTSTEANRRHQYFDLADEPVDEYVGSEPDNEHERCACNASAKAWLPTLPASVARHCGAYVDKAANAYWADHRAYAYGLVHRLGDNTYEESYAVPRFRGDDLAASDARDDAVREAFEHLRDAWYEKSARMGVLRDMVILPEYQRIIGLGKPVLPWIIDSLRKEPHHWSWALKAITGENPAAGATTLQETADRWIDWFDTH